MSKWQPIDSAPKEEDVLLLRTLGRPPIVAGFFDGAWRSFDYPDSEIIDVTHWMPLPAPPA